MNSITQTEEAFSFKANQTLIIFDKSTGEILFTHDILTSTELELKSDVDYSLLMKKGYEIVTKNNNCTSDDLSDILIDDLEMKPDFYYEIDVKSRTLKVLDDFPMSRKKKKKFNFFRWLFQQ